MVQVISKLAPIYVPCSSYVHPWTENCLEAICGCYLHAFLDSLRIYGTVYILALLMKGRIPNLDDVKNTFWGILRSSTFLSGTAFGYALFLCGLRKLLGNFNILSVSGLPAFLSSVFAILIEKPSRRVLLSLYVSNVATETLWNMAVVRHLVRPIKYGEVIMFSASIAALLAYYKAGLHKSDGDKDKCDSMFRVIRFVIGPYEEKDYTVRSTQANTICRQHPTQNNPSTSCGGRSWRRKDARMPLSLIMKVLGVYRKLIEKIKCFDRHSACPHPFSCLYYTMEGAGKMFSVGLGIQVALKLILNMKRIVKSPASMRTVLFRRDILKLGAFLGGFSGLFRGLSCILRRTTGKDSAYHAIPAGIIAGLAFRQYPDTTVSLYVLWKLAQITYNLGIQKGIVPAVPGFTAFLYCFSTAILFHAALLEPETLRPSYWKFLISVSGGRVACMAREPLDIWGLETTRQLANVLKRTNTLAEVQFYTTS